VIALPRVVVLTGGPGAGKTAILELVRHAQLPALAFVREAAGVVFGGGFPRYAAVIHLRTPAAGNGYNHANPLRIETAREAAAIDDAIAALWASHPNRHEVPASPHFLDKARLALEILARVLG
jgi:hypothetical protein